jgi:predicted 3-demethylubiquinone-9 3-methyltransferase (glyoxalase superfamily)
MNAGTMARQATKEPDMPTIAPFLWFESRAEEAMNFYTSIFKNSKVIAVHRAGDHVISVTFEMEGQKVMGLNGGPMYKFNEAISFFVSVETQEEVDEYWSKLTVDGGEPGRCGWLKDKFGLSWQIIPAALGRLMSSGDPEKARRVGQAMMQMNKLDIMTLQRAHDGV